MQGKHYSLGKECPYLGFFWFAFFRICANYREILNISPYSDRMRDNMDQKTTNTDTFYTVIY